ncbi:MAG: 2-oxoacid:acceptor oxidoreductase subunit alpha [archaeon]
MTSRGLVWLIGGPQGSGVDTGANIFSRAACYAGYNLFGKREYHSNIKGLHSYFHVRIDKKRIWSHSEEVNLLTSFDAETVFRHSTSVVQGGGIIYDQDLVQQDLSEILTIDSRFRADLIHRLSERGLTANVAGALSEAEQLGISLFPIPYMQLMKEIADKIGETQLSKVMRFKNVVAASISFALLGFGIAPFLNAIRFVFSDKHRVAQQNIEASQKAYDHAIDQFHNCKVANLQELVSQEERILVQGTQAIALGKIAGGARMQTYYPITPAADESEYLESNEVFGKREKGSILVFQAEDEIAAINMASAAALAGARVSTATSSPGFSLMVEGLSWAGNNEVPVVITHYQRGAPATGLPTRHGQDDLRFVLYGGHGEFARIVYASGDIEESFYDAARVFNYAERFQMPVVHIVDKALANSSATCPMFKTNMVKIERGNLSQGTGVELGKVAEYKRFAFTDSGLSPRIPLGTDGLVHWITGDEHDEFGHITENPADRQLMMEKRMKKLAVVDREIPLQEKWNLYSNGSDALVVTWGTPKGAALDAFETLEEEGLEMDLLQIKLIDPLPVNPLKEVLGRYGTRVSLEMNYSGQLASIIRQETGVEMSHYVLKYNGRPMSCDEVYFSLRKVMRGEATRREVLTAGN